MNCQLIQNAQTLGPLEQRLFAKDLSTNTLQKLSRVLMACQPPLLDIWNKIISSAQEKNCLSLLDAEVLSRLEDTKLFAQEHVYRILERIFSSQENVIDIFLCLATTYKYTYYDTSTFLAFLDHFSQFMDAVRENPLPSLATSVPCYDQGGKEWINGCLSTLQTQNLVKDQVQLWSGLPSIEKIQQAQKNQFPLIHSCILQTPLNGVGSESPKYPLSIHNLGTWVIKNLPHTAPRLPMGKYVEAQQLLESPEYQEVLVESDRVHLLQIILSLSNKPGQEGKYVLPLLYWYKTVKETLGEAIFSLISKPACYANDSTLHEAVQLSQLLIDMAQDIKVITPLLIDFFSQRHPLREVMRQLTTAKRELDAKKYPEKPLEEVLKAFRANALVAFPLSDSELNSIELEYHEIYRKGVEFSLLGMDSLIYKAKEIQDRCRSQPLSKEDKHALIAIGREAIRKKFHIYPYNTQILTVLGILNHPSQMKGRIAQVRTGEGKSTIVTLLTFYFACQGKNVDIITSSRYLAQRDQEKYADFFQAFSISSSHICEDHPNPDHFKGQILYGINSDFEFAIMRDYLWEMNLRKVERKGQMVPRPFDVVLVDEVDNLFIDSALNSARLSIAGRAKLNWIYHPILAFVQEEEVIVALALKLKNKELIKRVVEELREQLIHFQSGKFKDVVTTLNQRKLQTWIESAYAALHDFSPDREYVIKPKEKWTSKGKVCKDQIVIIDRENTGRPQEESRWQNGIHEFLEAKHDLTIEEESLMPASLCHPIFFSYYSSIYGLTGTMGPEIERAEVQEIYEVESFDVPSHKTNVRKILVPKVVMTQVDFLLEMLQEVQEMIHQKRPTLILFESIEETKDFSCFLEKQKVFHQLLNARQAEHEDFVVARAGASKMVTIATNTAGRGTDIILHPTSLESGGLHVIFTFYPVNDRVETQGFGRAGRQGQPGTARIILCSEHSLEKLKQQREARVQRSSIHRKERSFIETINHRYLQPFFIKLQDWQTTIDPVFIEEVDKKWKLQVKATATDQFDQITPPLDLQENELELHYVLLHHIQNTQSQDFSWIPFLQNVRATLIKKIQQDWAEFFYNELDDLYRNGKKDRAHYQVEIEKLYQSMKLHWEKYLLMPKEGFYLYLDRLCGR